MVRWVLALGMMVALMAPEAEGPWLGNETPQAPPARIDPNDWYWESPLDELGVLSQPAISQPIPGGPLNVYVMGLKNKQLPSGPEVSHRLYQYELVTPTPVDYDWPYVAAQFPTAWPAQQEPGVPTPTGVPVDTEIYVHLKDATPTPGASEKLPGILLEAPPGEEDVYGIQIKLLHRDDQGNVVARIHLAGAKGFDTTSDPVSPTVPKVALQYAAPVVQDPLTGKEVSTDLTWSFVPSPNLEKPLPGERIEVYTMARDQELNRLRNRRSFTDVFGPGTQIEGMSEDGDYFQFEYTRQIDVVAGYWNTRLSRTQGGTLNVQAVVLSKISSGNLIGTDVATIQLKSPLGELFLNRNDIGVYNQLAVVVSSLAAQRLTEPYYGLFIEPLNSKGDFLPGELPLQNWPMLLIKP